MFSFLFVLVPILVLIIFCYVIYINLKNTFRRLFGTNSIAELADIRDFEMEETPKSISGMESIERPKIVEDFPKMSIDELKSRDIDEIFAYYHALENGDFSRYDDNELFNDRMKSAIIAAQKNRYSLSNINIHRQSISRYTKTANTATINIQTSLEGFKKDIAMPDGKKTQLRVQTEWIYLLDPENFNGGLTTTLNCPNCGAPVSGIGNDYCEHCGSEITINYSRSWQLSYINEI